MAPNEHLLDNFNACKETRTLAGQLLREAIFKTAAGSGHEIGSLSTGLAAVCILIASERLNNGDVTKKAAQAAACLKPKDFSKVYTQVQAALETTTVPEQPFPETPTKRRKTKLSSSSTPLVKPFFLRNPSSTRTAPMKISPRGPESVIPSINIPSPASPLKRSLPVTNTTLDLPSTEESDVEDLAPSRRFRPVYLDCKQWNARDPHLARMWKKAEMRKQALIKQCGHPLDRYRHVDVEMDQDV